MAATVDEHACVAFTMRHGLIACTMLYRHCDGEMVVDAPCRRWRCRRKGCRDYEVSLLREVEAPPDQVLVATALLVQRSTGGIDQQWLDVSDVTAIDWYNYCRDNCSKEMLTCSMQIGGPGHIVEIDETSLKKKSKYVDRTTNLWFGILTGTDLKKKTLSPILRKHVKPNTTIISDSFAYANGKHTLKNNRFLRQMHYTHRRVNHEECFVDPVTGAHINRMEGAWEARIKRHLKRMRGVRKDLLAGYLDEFLWKTCFLLGRCRSAPTWKAK
ncbi:LOW QUALITY PROTEIN: Hypothetical protein PHPALM_5102 [Phytophthora palmivora]|uniref:ISXO2-like transposase domain-containing protein n=1 Tax=Phytophthora palmivora TaxID=4796 RepID=A0A2P4YI68_9STRA|nr:LOW QUALITY PROTEIN: Hypothetical protein PHPALM_5102 [Phytophthora palmivora]